MKGITVRQPHAAEIADGRKRIENRSWPPHDGFTGPLIIQAGVRYDGAAARNMPRGAICVVRSVAAHPIGDCALSSQLRQWDDGAFRCDEVGGVYSVRWRWHWVFYGVIPFPAAIPLAGRFGLFDVGPTVEAAARALLERG